MDKKDYIEIVCKISSAMRCMRTPIIINLYNYFIDNILFIITVSYIRVLQLQY